MKCEGEQKGYRTEPKRTGLAGSQAGRLGKSGVPGAKKDGFVLSWARCHGRIRRLAEQNRAAQRRADAQWLRWWSSGGGLNDRQALATHARCALHCRVARRPLRRRSPLHSGAQAEKGNGLDEESRQCSYCNGMAAQKRQKSMASNGSRKQVGKVGKVKQVGRPDGQWDWQVRAPRACDWAEQQRQSVLYWVGMGMVLARYQGQAAPLAARRVEGRWSE